MTTTAARTATTGGEAHPAPSPGRRAKPLDSAAYWLGLGSVYLLLGAVFYYPFKGKLFDDGGAAPPPIEKQFDGAFIDSFPGIDVVWVLLGVMQGLIVAALAVSLALREFLPGRQKSWLLAALCGAMLNLAVLAFGQSMTSQYDSVAELFAYFGATVVVFVFVLLMPPYRSARWLSSLVDRSP